MKDDTKSTGKKKALPPKEEAFCQSYLIDFNASRAAREAGYSAASAATIGWSLLRKADIQVRINELREDMGKAFNITRERIAQEYAKLAFYDIREIYEEEGGVKTIKELDDVEAAAVCGIEVSEEKSLQYETFINDEGETETRPKKIGVTKKIKLADKKAALDGLSRLMGYSEAQKIDLNASVAITPITGMRFKDRE
jgi:phage terminase small subunit